jgi:hypothetical protein
MTTPTQTPRIARRRTGAEEFHVETITLRPIQIEDPGFTLMEASEAAEILGMKRPNVTQLMDRGGLTVIRRSGSSRRWLLRAEVLALVALKGAPAPTGEA